MAQNCEDHERKHRPSATFQEVGRDYDTIEAEVAERPNAMQQRRIAEDGLGDVLV